MAQLGLRNFCNLAFLQEVDKPGVLARLLTPYAAYFQGCGIDVANLANDDATARALLVVFTQADETMPGELLEALHHIDAISDADGEARIFDEAARLGLTLSLPRVDLTAGDLAILAWLQSPGLVRTCHEKAISKLVKRYYEYPSRDGGRFDLQEFLRVRSTIETTLGAWFEERRRSRACQLFIYQEDSEIRILVTHGGLFRADGAITSNLRLSRLPWRPQKHDALIYDTLTGVLKVHTGTSPERQAYTRAFGEALARDPAFFMDAPCFSFVSLRSNHGVFRLADGLSGARITELVIETGDTDCRQITYRGEDLSDALAGIGPYAIPPGEIVRVVCLLRFVSGGRERKLDMRLPNTAEYNREREGEVYEAFVAANELMTDFDEREDDVARDLVDAD